MYIISRQRCFWLVYVQCYPLSLQSVRDWSGEGRAVPQQIVCQTRLWGPLRLDSWEDIQACWQPSIYIVSASKHTVPKTTINNLLPFLLVLLLVFFDAVATLFDQIVFLQNWRSVVSTTYQNQFLCVQRLVSISTFPSWSYQQIWSTCPCGVHRILVWAIAKQKTRFVCTTKLTYLAWYR